MKLQSIRALARCVILESLRRKDLWVVAILGFVIILASGALGFFGFDGLQIFAKDLGISVLGMLATIIAILTASRLLPEEIRNRTLYPLLSRPITRFELLLGKLAGAVAVSWISFVILSVLTGVALLIFKVQFEWIMLQYLVLKMLGLVVICSMTIAFSAYLTPAAAATMSFIFAFGSPMIIRGLTMGFDPSNPISKTLFPIINGVLPQVQLFDLSGRAVYPNFGLVPIGVVGFLVLYAVAYSSTMLGLGWLKFRKAAV
ncbi:MAG TPA: ABC transporter permease subunit [Fimbriimonas sp.]|nr:ABC transporter permease subunit [Fimbriimonas sp.]